MHALLPSVLRNGHCCLVAGARITLLAVFDRIRSNYFKASRFIKVSMTSKIYVGAL